MENEQNKQAKYIIATYNEKYPDALYMFKVDDSRVINKTVIPSEFGNYDKKQHIFTDLSGKQYSVYSDWSIKIYQ